MLAHLPWDIIVHCEPRAEVQAALPPIKGEGKEKASKINTLSAPLHTLFPSAEISYRSPTRGKRCRVTTSLPGRSRTLWTPAGMQHAWWHRAQPNLCDLPGKAPIPILFFSCKWGFHNLVFIIHFLQMSLIFRKGKRMPDSQSAETPARNGETIPAAEQKIQCNPAKTRLINQPNQPAAALLAAWCSPSKIPTSPVLWSSVEVHSYGESLLTSVFCSLNKESTLDIKSPTPRLPPSNCFHNTRGRQDSNKVLQSETSIYQWQKTSRNARRAQRTQEKVGVTSKHGQLQPEQTLCKGDSILFYFIILENNIIILLKKCT